MDSAMVTIPEPKRQKTAAIRTPEMLLLDAALDLTISSGTLRRMCDDFEASQRVFASIPGSRVN